MFHSQQYPPSQDYPTSSELAGNIAPNPYYNDIVSSGQDIQGGYQYTLPQQPEAGVAGAAFDMAFAQPYGIVDQNISTQNNSPLTYSSVPGQGYH